jgi:hypothetical protein
MGEPAGTAQVAVPPPPRIDWGHVVSVAPLTVQSSLPVGVPSPPEGVSVAVKVSVDGLPGVTAEAVARVIPGVRLLTVTE